ncbi:lipid-A-disaccharide synthase [Candidatus Paracaedibacter symbiosus]|uniref:lipid-A-disaccharide synthase n=1 Tax=Candidatus Paracaedibacter symbiosus TaxID=244582 RepID=UPI00068F848E|nr:lipid-A-disaccharide synthase [Candidatus Paracaedibacter symbiosus]
MKLFISSAEPSGDIIAAEVLNSLKSRLNGYPLHMSGIGGQYSEKQGLKSLFPMSDITVHGIVEVLPKVFQILKRIRQTADHIISQNPDLVITIDAFDFHIRVVKRLRKKGFTGKVIHLVAPAVWAWGAGRAPKLMRYYDTLYCLLPFEPPYFEKEGFQALYVGNPVLQRFEKQQPTPHFRHKYGIREEAFVLTILPGSRQSEVSRLLDEFLASAQLLLPYVPDIHVAIPTFEQFEGLIAEKCKEYDFPISIITQEDKLGCFANTNFAIAASGTVALELGLFNFPFIIAYKTSPITLWIAKLIAKVNYICLINILMNKLVVPELIQEKCNAHTIFETALSLIQDKKKVKLFHHDKQQALSMLKAHKESMPDYLTQHLLKEMPPASWQKIT